MIDKIFYGLIGGMIGYHFERLPQLFRFGGLLGAAPVCALDGLFQGVPENKARIKHERTSVMDTLKEMRKMSYIYAFQTAPLTRFLSEGLPKNPRGKLTFLSRLFFFCLEHFKYKDDTPGKEELRTPLRAWKDRHKGIDCDCFSVLIGAVLAHYGIPFFFRVVAYQKETGFQHVYVVAILQGKQIPIDPVAKLLNMEKPYLQKIDY